jgi:hypothetical protein
MTEDKMDHKEQIQTTISATFAAPRMPRPLMTHLGHRLFGASRASDRRSPLRHGELSRYDAVSLA